MNYATKKKEDENKISAGLPNTGNTVVGAIKPPETQKVDTNAMPKEAVQTPSASNAGTVKQNAYGYIPSAAVNTAKEALDSHIGAGPGEYDSPWDSQINDIVDQILNRKEFSYDVNSDALFDQYSDIHKRNAEIMAADTTGRAAAMTGGFGNSWASTLGASAYAAEMQKLDDRIPELMELAYSMYNDEGQELYNKYGLLSDREDKDYSKHRDTVSDFLTERDYLTGRYDTERSFDYGVSRDTITDQRYEDERKYQKDRDAVSDKRYDDEWQYQKDRDAVSDERYEDEWEYKKDRDAVTDQRYEDEWEYQKDRDAVTDQRYEDEWQYKKDRDTVSDQRYEDEWQYQKDQDAKNEAWKTAEYAAEIGNYAPLAKLTGTSVEDVATAFNSVEIDEEYDTISILSAQDFANDLTELKRNKWSVDDVIAFYSGYNFDEKTGNTFVRALGKVYGMSEDDVLALLSDEEAK